MITSVTLRVRCRCYPQGDSLAYITTAMNNARAAYNLLLEDYIWQIGLWQPDPQSLLARVYRSNAGKSRLGR